MAVKSIIDIDVNDPNFQRFFGQYQQYTNLLKNQPAQLLKIQNLTSGTVRSYRDLVSMEIASLARQRLMEEAHKTALRLTRSEADAWRDMVGSTKTTLLNITGMTTQLLRWGALTGVFSGLLGAGGLFGLERLGTAASSGRQLGLGTNTSFGEQRAFGTNFGRLVGPDMLNNVNTALTSASGRASLYGANVHDLSGSTADVAVRVLQGLKGIADNTPEALLVDTLKARGLDGLVSAEQFQRIKHTDRSELGGLLAGYGRDKNAFGLNDADLRKWQEFTTALDRAGNKIEVTFIQGLSKLAPGMEKLSDAVSGTVAKLLGSEGVNELLDRAGQGIETFAKYLGSEDFQNDVKAFAGGIKWIADKIIALGIWSGGKTASVAIGTGAAVVSTVTNPAAAYGPSAGPNASASISEAANDRLNRMLGIDHNPGNLRRPGQASGFASYGSNEDGVRAVARQLRLYANRDHIDTIQGIISKYAPASENDTAAYVRDVVRKTGFDSNKHLDLGDADTTSKLVSSIIGHEQGRGHYDQYKDASAVKVIIQNEAGGTIVTNTRQVAH